MMAAMASLGRNFDMVSCPGDGLLLGSLDMQFDKVNAFKSKLGDEAVNRCHRNKLDLIRLLPFRTTRLPAENRALSRTTTNPPCPKRLSGKR